MKSIARETEQHCRRHVGVILAVLCCVVGMRHLCVCALASGEREVASQLVVGLRHALVNQDKARVSQVASELKALGTNAIPAIRSILPECDDTATTHLIRVLSGIGGDDATLLLVESVGQSSRPRSSSQALHAIGNRPINFLLSTNQVGHFEREILNGHLFNAATAARVLSKCGRNDKAEMTRPILDRFTHQRFRPALAEACRTQMTL